MKKKCHCTSNFFQFAVVETVKNIVPITGVGVTNDVSKPSRPLTDRKVRRVRQLLLSSGQN